MYFQVKIILKSNHYCISKHPLIIQLERSLIKITKEA
jgi:hypothetical protein